MPSPAHSGETLPVPMPGPLRRDPACVRAAKARGSWLGEEGTAAKDAPEPDRSRQARERSPDPWSASRAPSLLAASPGTAGGPGKGRAGRWAAGSQWRVCTHPPRSGVRPSQGASLRTAKLAVLLLPRAGGFGVVAGKLGRPM